MPQHLTDIRHVQRDFHGPQPGEPEHCPVGIENVGQQGGDVRAGLDPEPPQARRPPPAVGEQLGVGEPTAAHVDEHWRIRRLRRPPRDGVRREQIPVQHHRSGSVLGEVETEQRDGVAAGQLVDLRVGQHAELLGRRLAASAARCRPDAGSRSRT